MKSPELPECGAVDGVTGATCSLNEDHPPPHSDESDWGCVVKFKDEEKLIVPDFGTGIYEVPIPVPSPTHIPANFPYYG